VTDQAVVIAGGGPTGLMLAGELALAGIDVAIVERRPAQALAGSRAGGLHSRTIEVLDQRGIADRFLSQGQVHKVVHFHIPLDVGDFPTRHNYVLGLWQNPIERILADWVGELGVPVLRAHEVTGVSQDGAGVDVELADGRCLRSEYLVGRRRTPPGAKSSRHRVRRMGRDDERVDCGGRVVRRAGMGHPHRRRWDSRDRQVG
jgi:3-(3-hydroxy-phenyl)propionate hydroxylase